MGWLRDRLDHLRVFKVFKLQKNAALDFGQTAWQAPGRTALAPLMKRRMSDGASAVLFVCSGNICRSAYAQARLEHLARVSAIPVKVMSCGTLRLVGRAASPEMQAEAARRGLDLSGHRSVPISRAIVAAADVIFAMEPYHAMEIVRLCPTAAERTFLLGQWLDPQSRMIADPMGKSAQFYRRVCDQIDEAVGNCMKNMT